MALEPQLSLHTHTSKSRLHTLGMKAQNNDGEPHRNANATTQQPGAGRAATCEPTDLGLHAQPELELLFVTAAMDTP